jgi:HD superfamily phosphohydrolase
MVRQKTLFDLTSKELLAQDSVIENLLKSRKTFRDAIHGDIMITELEKVIIDTKDFQRLQKIRQLGPTYFVFRSANHTRFEHSLGVLHMTQCLIEYVLKNPHKDPRVPMFVNLPYFKVIYPDSCTYSKALITNYHILLARTCALLHDLAHVPFGHTLEREGLLFEEEWNDRERVDRFLNDDFTIDKTITIGKTIIDFLNSKGLDGGKFLQEVRDILTAKKEEELKSLPYPFISDIINNTICADLLDYVKRDVYFCGLRENYDERFLTYFYIGIFEDKPRLVLRLKKPTTQRFRRDVYSETLHLLQLRYSLAEKVYYHHTKIIASGMIISAVWSAIKNKVIRKDELFGIGDEELLSLIEHDEIAKYLVEKLKTRDLYRPVYKLTYTEPKAGDNISERKSRIRREFQDKDTRYEAERALEIMNELKLGQVVIYCPGPEMGQKVVRTLIAWDNTIVPFEDINDNRIKNEIKTSIVDKHLELWNMYVFVDPDPDLGEGTKVNVASDCYKEFFHVANEIENEAYHQDRPSYRDRFRESTERELHIDITTKEHSEATASARPDRDRDPGRFAIINQDEYKTRIKEIKRIK